MDNDTVLMNISKLGSMSTAIGCEAMRQLETESGKGKEVYAHLDKLFKLLDDRNPYARTRARLRAHSQECFVGFEKEDRQKY